jgi:hypothetical protein
VSSLRTLKSLEVLLESFLTRAVVQKDARLAVLDGLNRLDDLTRACRDGRDVGDQVADWIAQRRDWAQSGRLRAGDISRVDHMLGDISQRIRNQDRLSPAQSKVAEVIDQWRRRDSQPKGKVTLRRGPEAVSDKPPATEPADSIGLFEEVLEKSAGLLGELAQGRDHLLSVLDDSLRKALVQKNKEALLLSAYIIYYLRIGGYKVSPYVERLRQAEKAIKEAKAHA